MKGSEIHQISRRIGGKCSLTCTHFCVSFTFAFFKLSLQNTAVQILESFKIDFHTVDVLADEDIRSGVKDFSQWPTVSDPCMHAYHIYIYIYIYCVWLGFDHRSEELIFLVVEQVQCISP